MSKRYQRSNGCKSLEKWKKSNSKKKIGTESFCFENEPHYNFNQCDNVDRNWHKKTNTRQFDDPFCTYNGNVCVYFCTQAKWKPPKDLPKLLLLYSTFFCGGDSGRLGWSVRTTFDDEYDDSSCRVPLLVILSVQYKKKNKQKNNCENKQNLKKKKHWVFLRCKNKNHSEKIWRQSWASRDADASVACSNFKNRKMAQQDDEMPLNWIIRP